MSAFLVFDSTNKDFFESDVAGSLILQYELKNCESVICDANVENLIFEEYITVRLIGYVACSELEISSVWIVCDIEDVSDSDLRKSFGSMYIGQISVTENLREQLISRCRFIARKRLIFSNRQLSTSQEKERRTEMEKLGFDEKEIESWIETQNSNRNNEALWQLSCVARWAEEAVTHRPLFQRKFLD